MLMSRPISLMLIHLHKTEISCWKEDIKRHFDLRPPTFSMATLGRHFGSDTPGIAKHGIKVPVFLISCIRRTVWVGGMAPEMQFIWHDTEYVQPMDIRRVPRICLHKLVAGSRLKMVEVRVDPLQKLVGTFACLLVDPANITALSIAINNPGRHAEYPVTGPIVCRGWHDKFQLALWSSSSMSLQGSRTTSIWQHGASVATWGILMDLPQDESGRNQS